LEGNVQAESPELAIRITVHMWITWADLAIEHQQRATADRASFLVARASGDTRSDWLGRETGDSVLSICSTAFAMETLLIAWTRLVMDQETASLWESREGRKPGTTKRLQEVIKRCTGSAKMAASLRARWEIVFERRGGAVHYSETETEPAFHPDAAIGKVAPIHIEYSSENAAEAVSLLMETIGAVKSANLPPLRTWLSSMSSTLNSLELKRDGRVATGEGAGP
jgi:hypothetical protein